MSRIGINPSRFKKTDYQPAQVTVCVLTYLPHLEGYFRQRLEILKLSLGSLAANIGSQADVLVFDNGSCREALEYLDALQQSGRINFLIRSKENIGKIGAWQLMFSAAPGEIIAYGDDDIYYYPGWLEAGLEVMNAFPKAGMVSCVPVRNASTYAVSAVEAAVADPSSEVTGSYERRIPDEWEADWALSTGRDPQEHLEDFKDRPDLVLRANSVEAIAGANHYQFMAPRQLLLDSLPGDWIGRLMGHMVEVDETIDQSGFLRISTTGRFTRHIGNQISPDLAQEAAGLDIKTQAQNDSGEAGRRSWIAKIPGSRRLALALYDRLFDVINSK
ncbi:MAG: glycosyltransferase [Anaerolineales bacterium]|nr:glycosyltransferase [Anaerolineales bacterium]